MNKRQYKKFEKKFEKKIFDSMGYNGPYRLVPTVFLDGTISSIFKQFNPVYEDYFN